MQFYLDGYRPGDPDIQPAADDTRSPRSWRRSLRFARDSSSTATVRSCSGRPTASPVPRWVTGSTRRPFADEPGAQDTEDNLSEFPHLIVNQARMQQYLLDYMSRSSSRLAPDYGIELVREYTQDKVIAIAQRVLRPYTLDVRDVVWFAVYQVGQRVTDRIDARSALPGARRRRSGRAEAGFRQVGSVHGGGRDALSAGDVPDSAADAPGARRRLHGRFGLVDYEKAFSPDPKNGRDIFDLRAIEREHGAMVVVRPDQYVANVLPLDAHHALTAFFAQFMLDRR